MAQAATTAGAGGGNAPRNADQERKRLKDAAQGAYNGRNGWSDRLERMRAKHAEAVKEREAHRGQKPGNDPVAQERLNASAPDLCFYASSPKEADRMMRDAFDNMIKESQEKAAGRNREFKTLDVTTGENDVLFLSANPTSYHPMENGGYGINSIIKVQMPFKYFSPEDQQAINAERQAMGLKPFVVGTYRQQERHRYDMHDRIVMTADARFMNPRIFGFTTVPNRRTGAVEPKTELGAQRGLVSEEEARAWAKENPGMPTSQWAYCKGLAEGESAPAISTLLTSSPQESEAALYECSGHVVVRDCFPPPGTSIGTYAETMSNSYSSRLGEGTFKERAAAARDGKPPPKKEPRGEISVNRKGKVDVEAPVRGTIVKGGALSEGCISHIYITKKTLDKHGPGPFGVPIAQVRDSMKEGGQGPGGLGD